MQAVIKDERFKSFIGRIKAVCDGDVVHIEGHNDTIKIVAVGSVNCSATFGASVAKEGKVCLSINALFNIMQCSYGHNVRIKNRGLEAEVNIHNRRYVLQNYQYDTPYVDLEEENYHITLNSLYFIKQTGKLRRFVYDECFNNMANTHFVNRNGIFIAEATDGNTFYRVHLTDYNHMDIDDEFMVNTKALMKFRKSIFWDRVRLYVHDNHMSIKARNELYAVKINSKEKWYDTSKFTSMEGRFGIELNKADFEYAMKRMSYFANELNPVRIELQNNMLSIKTIVNEETVACTLHGKKVFDSINIDPKNIAGILKDMRGNNLMLDLLSNDESIIMTTEDDSMIAVTMPCNPDYLFF